MNKESRYSDRKSMLPQASPVGQAQEISLAKVVTGEGDARAWRITLSRLDRQDTNGPLVPGGSNPLFVSQQYSYAAGSQSDPQIPPRRSNPVFGSSTPQNGASVLDAFVQLNWGMAQTTSNRMIAQWPAQGASIVVVGSFVEVFGAGAIFDLGNPPLVQGEMATFAASITPADGLAVVDAGELSITQKEFLATFSAGGFNTALALGPDGGFEVAELPQPAYALQASAVADVGPFSPWGAVIRPTPLGGAGRLVISVQSVPDAPSAFFVLQDNAIPTGVGATFIASPGDVGIAYGHNFSGVSMKTIAQLEALIGTSGLIFVQAPSANPTFIVDLWGVNGDPGEVGVGIGVGEIASATLGGAVYVPDFARRVRVDLVAQDDDTGVEMPPITGQPACRLVWYDDQGTDIGAMFQGAITGGSEPVAWHPVPAAAVMLAIYQEPSTAGLAAFVHWRLAP